MMEFKTPLNEAHNEVRKAENFLKNRNFHEAIELQDRIVQLLEGKYNEFYSKISPLISPTFLEALLDARDLKIKESLRAQIEFHRKQTDLIRVKQASWEEFCRQVASLQIRMSNISADGSSADGLQVSSLCQPPRPTFPSCFICRTRYFGLSKRRSPCWNTSGSAPWWRPPCPASPARGPRCRRTTRLS